jgi:hypothetical protein
MKKLLCTLILSAPIMAVAQNYDATQNLRKSSTITWVAVSDANKTCVEEFAKIGVRVKYRMDACAIWSGNTCKIITRAYPTESSVGHEVMHCFQEQYH